MNKYFNFLIIIFVLILCFFISQSEAVVYKQINFEWEYDTNLPGLAGYILFKNGEHLYTVSDPKALSVDLNVGIEPGSVESFTMKAFDNKGNESALSAPYNLSVPVAVENNNFLPLPMITSYIVGYNVELTALGSSDFDGNIVSYLWNFGDGNSSSSLSVSHTFLASGTYIITLTIADNSGGVSLCSKEIYINSIIKKPINIKFISN